MKKEIFILMFLVMLSNVYALTHMTPELFQERYNLEIKILDEAPIIELDEDVVSYYVVIDNELIDFTDFVYLKNIKDYQEDAPCVSLGEQVWPFEYCCNGAEPYLSPYATGQHRCKKLSSYEKITHSIKYNLTTQVIILLILVFLVLGIIFVQLKKDKRKKGTKNIKTNKH